ncbi:flagellar hook capping FlgD N-terminal domain-containing protein [Cellulosilyticum sp. ST5]|uniref:flagellar hook assembly protein FlgD n=1 Tax=Cellulosilyticum sp. ST5 TaxID=3055805 RepID=UPI0039774194
MSTTISKTAALNSDYLKVTEEVKEQSELDKDAFINLLVTQMKYQDPLDPVDNSEMLAQLAQFTALEQMMNVAQASQKQLANGMIGKYVEYLYKDSETGTSEYLVGKVDYVKVSGDTPVLGIGDVEVNLEDVYQVYDSSNIQANTTAFELLGKTVQGLVEETKTDGTKESIIIEGEVLGIEMKNGSPYMVIGTGKEKVSIDFNKIQNIVDKPSITGKTVTGTYTDSEGKVQTITGTAEYIRIEKAGTFVYVRGEKEGQFVNFNHITLVEDK